MALTIANSAGGGAAAAILYRSPTRTPYTHFHHRFLSPPSHTTRPLHVVQAKKLSSRTGRFDSKKRRGLTTTKDQEDEEEEGPLEDDRRMENIGVVFDDEKTMPELPGEKTDFWEGSQWDPLGFFLQYMWAFGIVFALVACGIAVSTYNEGASDFKEMPAYKESVQSRDLLEEPEASNPDVFDSNPTEVAPPTLD